MRQRVQWQWVDRRGRTYKDAAEYEVAVYRLRMLDDAEDVTRAMAPTDSGDTRFVCLAQAAALRRALGHTGCRRVRTMLLKHSTLNLTTGETAPGATEWVTRPCGTPLFSDNALQSGLCNSCAKGWTHSDNYPAGTVPPAKQ